MADRRIRSYMRLLPLRMLQGVWLLLGSLLEGLVFMVRDDRGLAAAEGLKVRFRL